PKAIVTVKVTEPGFDDLRGDATCGIHPQSLIGEYYVDCQPGSSRQRLPDGGVVPVTQTEGTVNQDLINDVMRRPYRERLRLIISDLGAGLAGNPGALQEVLRRADPALRQTSKLRGLGRASTVGNVAFRHSRKDVDALRRAARYAPGLAKPLRQFLQTLDDRRYATERDPTIDPLAPKPPDPTANANGRGQTGFESFLSYVFHQS